MDCAYFEITSHSCRHIHTARIIRIDAYWICITAWDRVGSKYQSDNFIKLSLGSWPLAAARKAGRVGHILSDPSRLAYRALIGARQARHCVKKMDASLLLLQEPPIRTGSSFWPPRRQMGCVMGCKVQAYMTGGSRWSDRRFPSDSLFTRLFVAGFDSCFLPVQPRLHCQSRSR